MNSNITDPPPLNCTFCIMYQKTTKDERDPRKCTCDLTLEDYQVKPKNTRHTLIEKKVQFNVPYEKPPTPYNAYLCLCHFLFKTHYITKTEVLPKDERENCQAGEMAGLKFNVKCVENSVNQDQLLFYDIVCDSNNWAPAGKTSGKNMKFVFWSKNTRSLV